MYRITPFALALLAGGCAASPTQPEAEPAQPATPVLTPATGGPAAWLLLSATQTFAANTPASFALDNEPAPRLGEGRVVWADQTPAGVQVRGYDLARAAGAAYGTTQSGVAPVGAGRYAAWVDAANVLQLRVEGEAAPRPISSNATPAAVSAQGRLLYITDRSQLSNLVLYDAATRSTRRLTDHAPPGPQTPFVYPMEAATDGDLVAWVRARELSSSSTVTLVVLNLATGEQREVITRDCCAIARVAVSQGRVAWIGWEAGRSDANVYDWASGTSRRVTSAAAKPLDLSLSGDLLVTRDWRNDRGGRFPESDIYLLDLLTGTELAVASGPREQAHPMVDGNRITWTELVNQRWELRTASVQRLPALAGIAAAVDGLRRAGEIADDAAAEALQGDLAATSRAEGAGDAAAERDALAHFRAQVVAWSGTRITPHAAASLTGMVDAISPVVHAG
jgi:hypothetical protein